MGKTIKQRAGSSFYFCAGKSASLKNIILILISALLLPGCGGSDSHAPSKDDSLEYYPPTPVSLDRNEFRRYYRLMTSFFDTTLLKTPFSGGIIIAKNGSVIYEKYQGMADLQHKIPMTDSTSLHMASTGKTFTATAVLRLVQESRLSLSDSVNKFFPDFPYPGITVKMLLNHRSGLPNYLYFMSNSDWDKKRKATNEDVIKMMYSLKPNRVSSPNTRFTYCNTNFLLLASIIEKVTGTPFPQYMEQKFFIPLGMTHTYVFTLKDTLTATPSSNYNGNYWDYDFLDGTYGDKNVYSTPRDMLKWDQSLYTDQVLDPAMKDSAFTGYSFEKPGTHNYGLGWHLEILPNGKKVIYHYGKWHGFNAAFARLTDEKVTIIILGNRFNRSIYSCARKAYDFFGEYKQDRGHDNPEADTLENDARKPAKSLKKESK